MNGKKLVGAISSVQQPKIYTIISTRTQIEFDTGLVPHPRDELGLGQGYIAIYRRGHLSGVAWKPATTSARHMYRGTARNILQI